MILNMAIFFLLALLLIIVVYGFIRKVRISSSIPTFNGFPFVGFLPYFGNKDYQRTLVDIIRTHGKMCKVRLGSYQCLWLNDSKLIRDAWNNPIFCGRPKLPGITKRTHGFSGGIIFNDGSDFYEQRKFTVKHLKDFGLGKLSMEKVISDEVDAMILNLNQRSGILISTRHLFNKTSFNILWTIVSGETFDHNDKEFNDLVETLARNMELQGGALLGFFMPWITKILPEFVGWNEYISDSNKIFEFWRQFAREKIQLWNNEIEPSCLVDIYIKRIKECDDESSSFFGERGELSLASTLQDLFIAGTETTATTLSWLFLFTAVFQDYQNKLYEEISKNVGSRKPTLLDRRNMPWTEAFILETMRYVTLAPLGMIHCTLDNTTLNGHAIPKGTLVHANLCAAHRDPEVWGDANNFRPERFISSDGKRLLRHESFLPFSYGKRGCPGEALAKKELFIFLTGFIQAFQVTVHPTSDICLLLLPKMGVSATPRPHSLKFKVRSS